ncbi:hypothetical protein MPER_09760 [Moniliophthora perniciosa FA553]|nr:hypothetical protein MPER_09760 [Moniliophthora perniciosa FA553]
MVPVYMIRPPEFDPTNPEAREFLWRRLNESYFSKGIHNFWIDQADGGVLGEPVENIGDGDVSNIPYARAFTQYYIGTQEATGKMYPWFQQKAIEEGFQNLTGLENLPKSFGVSAAVSGISSWTLDIGGFVGLNVESEPMRVHGDRDCSIPTPRTLSNANACPNERVSGVHTWTLTCDGLYNRVPHVMIGWLAFLTHHARA